MRLVEPRRCGAASSEADSSCERYRISSSWHINKPPFTPHPPHQTFHPPMQACLGGILPGSERNRRGLSNRTTQASGEESGADVWVYFLTLCKAERSCWRFRMREFCVLYMEICGLAAEIKAVSEEKDDIKRGPGPIRVQERSESE